MSKFNVDMKELVYYHIPGIEADSQEEAEAKVREMWLNAEITSDDCELEIIINEVTNG